jgi:hypothetical protein
MNSNNMSSVSNVSAIQKELKPNKIVNKGNSVFSNHHKLHGSAEGHSRDNQAIKLANGIQKVNVRQDQKDQVH